MKTCPYCEKDILEEDLTECDSCHKKFCPDCIINIGNDTDDLRMKCKNCLAEGGE